MRALEPKCASPHSLDSKRTVAQLSEQLLAYKEVFLHAAVYWGLSNLVRCALEAKISEKHAQWGRHEQPGAGRCCIQGSRPHCEAAAGRWRGP